jgi:hypothetical protein
VRVALLLGLPVSEEEYLRRALESNGARGSDFLARFDDPGADPADRLAHLKESWRRRYEPKVAVPIKRLIEAARACGCCRIVRAAALSDVAESAREAEAIVILSHWKGPELKNDDLRAPSGEIAACLAMLDHPLARWIVRETAPKRGLAGLFGAPPALRDALRSSLEAEMEGEVPAGADLFIELPQTRRSRRRDLLDLWLDGALTPGNRLELFDGLHDKEAVADALTDFEGIVDLTACTTTYLGDYLFLRSEGRFHTVQFLEEQEPVDLAARLAATLELVGGGYDYLAARALVGEQLKAMAG